MKEKIIVFSTITGLIQEYNYDDKLSPYEILLNDFPDKNCKKCYGRMHVGKNISNKNSLYTLCTCSKKYINIDNLLKEIDKEKKFTN